MIYVTGDVHGNYDVQKLNHLFYKLGNVKSIEEGRKKNYLIIAGDFGGIWRKHHKGSIAPHDLEFIHDFYGRMPWTTLWVDGNHENFDIINNLPVIRKWDGRVHEITPYCYHLMRGEVYNLENFVFLAMGGAYSVDKSHRTKHLSWWPQELITEDEYANALVNLDRYNFKVDFIVSHTCPNRILTSVQAQLPPAPYPEWDLKFEDPSCAYLEEIAKRTDYNRWYFGHFHQDISVKPDDDGPTYRMLYQDVIQIKKPKHTEGGTESSREESNS